MTSILVPAADSSITLSPSVAKRLLDCGNGDAALLYIAMLRHQGTVPPRSLAGELRWEKGRIESAEAALQGIGLLTPAAEEKPEPADERPDYSQQDIIDFLNHDEDYSSLVTQVERRLGKKLSTPDLKLLAELRDHIGLPADVIFLLVNHCCQRIQRRYGEGRKPTMRQINKEGYLWDKKGLVTQTAANNYLREYDRRQGMIPAYMRALNLGDRLPVPSEEKYLVSWQEWGFPPEVVGLACDKTVLKCHELKWAYCNAILRRWHEAGLHTLEQVEAQDRPAPKTPSLAAPKAPAPQSDNAWMRQFIQQRKEE